MVPGTALPMPSFIAQARHARDMLNNPMATPAQIQTALAVLESSEGSLDKSIARQRRADMKLAEIKARGEASRLDSPIPDKPWHVFVFGVCALTTIAGLVTAAAIQWAWLAEMGAK